MTRSARWRTVDCGMGPWKPLFIPWVRRPTGSRLGPAVTWKCTELTSNRYPFNLPAPDIQGPDTPDTRGNAASCALCVGMVESVKLIVY